MLKSNMELMRKCYDEGDYSEITFEQFQEVCYGPWRYLKQEMESGELEPIRFKYFGVFKVYPGMAKAMLNYMKKMVETNKLHESLKPKIEMLKKFLKL